MSDEFVDLASFTYPHEAHVARAKLESAGIETYLLDEHMITMNWLNSHALGGIKLRVRPHDLEEARGLLGEEHHEEDEGWGACPGCGSLKLELRLNKRSLFLTWILLGFPLQTSLRRLVCMSCGAVIKR